MQSKRGMFITFEGLDGSGKTTISNIIDSWLQGLGRDVVRTREPGGTGAAEEIRNVLFSKRENETIDPIAEVMLFAASRRQHVVTLIKPSVDAGKIVVSDRFYESSFVYQGFGRGLLKEVMHINHYAIKDCYPDLTFYLHVPIEVTLERMAMRQKEYNRLNSEDIEFRKRCYAGFEVACEESPNRIKRIDATQKLNDVVDAIKAEILKVL